LVRQAGWPAGLTILSRKPYCKARPETTFYRGVYLELSFYAGRRRKKYRYVIARKILPQVRLPGFADFAHRGRTSAFVEWYRATPSGRNRRPCKRLWFAVRNNPKKPGLVLRQWVKRRSPKTRKRYPPKPFLYRICKTESYLSCITDCKYPGIPKKPCNRISQSR